MKPRIKWKKNEPVVERSKVAGVSMGCNGLRPVVALKGANG